VPGWAGAAGAGPAAGRGMPEADGPRALRGRPGRWGLRDGRRALRRRRPRAPSPSAGRIPPDPGGGPPSAERPQRPAGRCGDPGGHGPPARPHLRRAARRRPPGPAGLPTVDAGSAGGRRRWPALGHPGLPRPQPGRAGAGAAGAAAGRVGHRPLRHRGRPRLRRRSRRHPGLRPRRDAAGGAGRLARAAGGGRGDAQRAAGAAAAGAAGPQAAGRRRRCRAEPRPDSRSAGHLPGRCAAARADHAGGGVGGRLHRRAVRRGADRPSTR